MWTRLIGFCIPQVTDDGNLVYSGTYGRGTFKVTERCFASQEIGEFNPGDKFVGRFECDREGGTGDGVISGDEEDIRRMELFVNSRNSDGVIATVTLDMDDNFTEGEYIVSGSFVPGRPIVLTPNQSAWTTSHPSSVPARQLSGSLSDDGEFYIGQFNLNPLCACNGLVAPHHQDSVTGSFCGLWGEKEAWCYVNESCAEATESRPSPGYFRAPCKGFQTCTDFRLSRVCSQAAALCDAG